MARFAAQFLALELNNSIAGDGVGMLPVPEGARSLFASTSQDPATPAEYPAPDAIARFYHEKYGSIPRFLLPPSHAQHIPPHIVAHEIFSRLQTASQ